MSRDDKITAAMDFIKTVGFPTVVALLLMWAMNEQIVALRSDSKETRDYVRDVLTAQLDRSTTVLEKNNELMGRMLERLDRDKP